MTKRQMLEACRRLAPDFALTFDSPNGAPRVTARCTLHGEPLEIAHPIGPLGRAAVETKVLDGVFARLRRDAA